MAIFNSYVKLPEGKSAFVKEVPFERLKLEEAGIRHRGHSPRMIDFGGFS